MAQSSQAQAPPAISGVAFNPDAFSLDSFDAESFDLGESAVVDVRVSFVAFDTQATPCDVKVSWLAFDTQAVPCDVRVSWLAFDSRLATVANNSAQGVAPKSRFYPLIDATITLRGAPAICGTSGVVVESRSATQAPCRSTAAHSGGGGVAVQTVVVAPVSGAVGRAGTTAISLSCVASVGLRSSSSRSGSSVVLPFGEAEAALGSGWGYAGSVGAIKCDTVKDISDEELVYWYLHSRPIDKLTSKHV